MGRVSRLGRWVAAGLLCTAVAVASEVPLAPAPRSAETNPEVAPAPRSLANPAPSPLGPRAVVPIPIPPRAPPVPPPVAPSALPQPLAPLTMPSQPTLPTQP